MCTRVSIFVRVYQLSTQFLNDRTQLLEPCLAFRCHCSCLSFQPAQCETQATTMTTGLVCFSALQHLLEHS